MNSGEWVPGEVFIPEGLHLPQAQGMTGIQRALLFGTEHGTSGPTLFRPSTPTPEGLEVTSAPNLPEIVDPKTLAVAAVALAVGVVSTLVVIKHGPKIKEWWTDKAFPTLLSGVMRLADVDPGEFFDTKSEAAAIGPVPTVEFSREVATVMKDLREDISSEEARQRLLLVLVAGSIISAQMRKLQNARIRDEDFQALRAAMTQLATGEVVDRLNEILSTDHLMVDETTREMFVKVFGGGQFINGAYQPLDLGLVEGTLRLTDGDDDDPGDGDAALTPTP